MFPSGFVFERRRVRRTTVVMHVHLTRKAYRELMREQAALLYDSEPARDAIRKASLWYAGSSRQCPCCGVEQGKRHREYCNYRRGAK